MERTARKALTVLVVMLIVFGAYSYYLFAIKPESRAVIFTFVDSNQPVLDGLDNSSIQEMFSQPDFLLNYTVDNSPDDGLLQMYPNNNPDVVFTFENYNGDVYFLIQGFMKVTPLGTWESYPDLQEEAITEMRILLDHMGYGGQTSYDHWDSYNSVGFPELEHMAGFFGFAALILVYIFAMLYRRGWILEEGPAIENFPLLMVGLFMIYLGTGLGLLLMMSMSMRWMDEFIVCTAAPAILLLVGYYFVFDVAKKQS